MFMRRFIQLQFQRIQVRQLRLRPQHAQHTAQRIVVFRTGQVAHLATNAADDGLQLNHAPQRQQKAEHTQCNDDPANHAALLDPIHPQHAVAHAWFATARASWASCNLTQNGALRIMSHPRYANAVAFTGCSPADVTWRAGVDALSFGFTKNGAMMAEALVFFGGSGGAGGSSSTDGAVERIKKQIQALKSQLNSVASHAGSGNESAVESKVESLEAQIASLEAQLAEAMSTSS